MMRETMRNAEENARIVRALAAQGLVAEYDLLRAEVAVDNVRPSCSRPKTTAPWPSTT